MLISLSISDNCLAGANTLTMPSVSACSPYPANFWTTFWPQLEVRPRQWLVNTLQWMKGLGIKWQDVLKKRSRWWLRKGQLGFAGVQHHISHYSFFFSPFHSSSCSVSTTLDLSHLSVAAHLFLFISLPSYCLVFPFSIPIVKFHGSRAARSLTQASDNWHSWDWTFRSSPIHMYSKQRDKSHPTSCRAHPPQYVKGHRGMGWIWFH